MIQMCEKVTERVIGAYQLIGKGVNTNIYFEGPAQLSKAEITK